MHSTLPYGAHLTATDRDAITERYELIEEVGRGAMGAVYRARHFRLDRPVAVKVCLPGGHADRFVREAQLLARLRSPHVVAVHDLDQLPDGRSLLVMDWVEGCDLGRLLGEAGGAIAESRAVPWMRQVCEGMRAAAEQGVVHRDLKPSNILIDGSDAALVADFGLARAADADAALTHAEGAMGTPHYMAPEQAEDARRADARSDIYSFGATFYHVLAGRPPFEAESSFSVMFKHKMEPLVSPRAHNPALSERVGECLERCLAKSPGDRFQTFGELARTLAAEPSAGADPWDEDDPETAPYLELYRSRRAGYLTREFARNGPCRYPFRHGRSLAVVAGRIAEQRVDAVVSPASERIKMRGTSSGEIDRAAGPSVYQEAQKFVPARRGRAVVTGAGDLPARFVFHAVTNCTDSASAQWIAPTRDIINEVMESCFYHAETLHVRSIAFPLLTRGYAGIPHGVCLDAMFRFLVRKFARGATDVREARIVLS